MPMPDCMFIPYNIALYGSVMSVVRGLHTNVVSFGLAHYWVFDRYKTDKNHNPRKGTGKKKAAQSSQFPLLGEC